MDDDLADSKLKAFPVPKGYEKLPGFGDLEAITLAFKILAEERERRPALVHLLEKYPPLLADYVTLPLYEKFGIEIFRQEYGMYFGGGHCDGDCIRALSKQRNDAYGAAAMIARKYRWAEQLTELFAFYSEREKKKSLTNHYLQTDPSLRKHFGTKGVALVRGAYQNDVAIADIVALVAYVDPRILDYYRAPGYRSNVVHLKRK